MSNPLNLDALPEPSARIRLAAASDVRPSAAAPPPAEIQVDELHLLDYVKMLHKRRWTAATAFLVVLVGVTVYTFTATPMFEAKTRLLIESDDPNVVSFKEVINEEQAKADYYQTQYNVLQSRALARKTIASLELWDNPFFAAASESRKGVVGALAGMLGRTSAGTHRQENGAEPTAVDETAAQSRAIDLFLDRLTVAPIRNSRLVDIKYRSPDATLATSIVNALAKNYIEQNLEYKFTSSKEASDWLGERLTEQRKQVEAAELKLQQYREQNDAISLEDRENIVVQKLADLNGAVTQAKAERFQKQALYNQLQSLRSKSSTAALDSFPAILSNTYIQQQKAELAQLQAIAIGDSVVPRDRVDP